MWQQKINISNKKRKYRQRGKLCYNTKDYANPFFSQNKRAGVLGGFSFSWRAKLISSGLLLAVFGIVWFLFYSSFFSIKNVEIRGGSGIEAEAIEKIVWQRVNGDFFVFLPQKNIFFFKSGGLYGDLEAKYSFNKLAIEKKLPDTIIVDFAEKQYAFIWQENDAYYYADISGFIITEANLLEISQKEYPIIENRSEHSIADKNITVDKKYLDAAMELFRTINESATAQKLGEDFRVERYILDLEINTVKIKIENGPEIYFNTDDSMEKQVNKLLIIKNEKIKEDFLQKSYINLKFGDRVYYR